MRLLVTGGGGFIGSALLLKISDTVKVISLDHGRNYAELQGAIGNNVQLVKGDIKDGKLLDELLPKVDVVMHFAGGGGNRACMNDPVKAVMDNVYGTHLLVQKALQHDIKRFLFASTQSVYVTTAKRKMPLTEDMIPKPDDFYGALKTVAEYEIMDNFNDYMIFRFANVYGYGSGLGAQWGGVIGKFIKKGCGESEITVFGSGKQKVDFIHINDAVRAILTALEKESIKNETFNIGGGVISIEEVAKTVSKVAEEAFGRHVEIRYVPAPPDKIWPDRWLSIKKAKELLNWHPEISLEEGISEMMKKYMEVID